MNDLLFPGIPLMQRYIVPQGLDKVMMFEEHLQTCPRRSWYVVLFWNGPNIGLARDAFADWCKKNGY